MSIRAYFNESTGTVVKFYNDEDFVIIGDSDKVSDAELLSLSRRELPAGWEDAE